MISTNLQQLRKRCGLSQEAVAEKINVTRQSVAKWESGENVPDINNCAALAELFDVTVDDLINHSIKDSGLVVPPKGKYFFGAVTVGERGQVVIPKKAREVFGIAPGDQLLVLGDEDRGLAIVHQRDLLNFVGMAGIAPKMNAEREDTKNEKE